MTEDGGAPTQKGSVNEGLNRLVFGIGYTPDLKAKTHGPSRFSHPGRPTVFRYDGFQGSWDPLPRGSSHRCGSCEPLAIEPVPVGSLTTIIPIPKHLQRSAKGPVWCLKTEVQKRSKVPRPSRVKGAFTTIDKRNYQLYFFKSINKWILVPGFQDTSCPNPSM